MAAVLRVRAFRPVNLRPGTGRAIEGVSPAGNAGRTRRPLEGPAAVIELARSRQRDALFKAASGRRPRTHLGPQRGEQSQDGPSRAVLGCSTNGRGPRQ